MKRIATITEKNPAVLRKMKKRASMVQDFLMNFPIYMLTENYEPICLP
jgi:hypothetical protein